MSKRRAVQQTAYSVGALDFSSVKEQQTVIESQHLQEIPAITALPRDTSDNAPLDFRVDRTDHFLDLNETYLYIKLNVLHADDSSLEDDEFVTTINNLGYSMWNSVDLFINDYKVTADNTYYPWMSYVHFLTKCPVQYRNSALATSLWHQDQAEYIEYSDFTKGDQPSNSGCKARGEVISNSQPVELYSKLFLDFINFSQLLPSNTELAIRLTPVPTSLALIHAGDRSYKIRIQQAKLYVGKVRLTKFALAHYQQLLAKGNFRYNTRRYTVHTKLMQAKEQNLDWMPFAALKRPRRLYVWHVDQTAYNSAAASNAFNFQYIEMDRFQLYCNDVSYPSNVPWKVSENDIARMYLGTTRAINNADAWNVDIDAYRSGFFVAVIDITKDQSATANYNSTIDAASVRLIIDYRKPLAKSIAVFCMCEYDDELQLDSNAVPKWRT
jgi:hypothetical protein